MKQESSLLHLRGLYIEGFRGRVGSMGEARTGYRELLQRLGRKRRGSDGEFEAERVESDRALAVCGMGKFGIKCSRLLLCPDETMQS